MPKKKSPRYGPFLFSGLFDGNIAHPRHFWPYLGRFLDFIVELGGKKGLYVTRQLRRMWSAATVCLRLAVLSGFWGRFGPKKVFFQPFVAV